MRAGMGVMLCATVLLGCSPQHNIERSVALQGQPNFRDIGGYETADGRVVKTGILYRSGRLNALSASDVQTLENLGVEKVVNFLTPGEIEDAGQGRLPERTQELHIPIDSGDGLAGEIVDARKTGDFSKIPADLNPKLHVMLADEAKEEYAALIRAVIAADGTPMAYHCSHGIHRTGTATALILSAVGVSWETVRADYLLSNQTRAEEIEMRTEQLRQLAAKHFNIPPDEVDMTNINAFYILEGHYIDGTLEYIEQHYGDVDTYLIEGLGLSPQEIEQLKQILLK